MSRRSLEHNGRIYVYSPGDEIPLARNLQAIVQARLIDEITMEPPAGIVTIETGKRGLIPRVLRDGLVGFAGVPELVFTDLATDDSSIDIAVRAEGYIQHTKRFEINANLDFPDSFLPPPSVDIHLHREPVIIAGRTVLSDGSTTTPVAGAKVEVIGILKKMEDLESGGFINLNMVSLHPHLYFTRPSGSNMTLCTKTLVTGEDKILLEDARQGAGTLRLSNSINLSPGDIIAIEPDDPDRREYIPVQTLAAGNAAALQATVGLGYPSIFPHRRDATIQKVLLNIGPAFNLNEDARSGDICVFLVTLAGLGGDSVIVISGGSNPDEYHDLSTFSVTSDAEGYYRLPPLHRVAHLRMHADDGGALSNVPLTYSPDYASKENRVDFVFKP